MNTSRIKIGKHNISPPLALAPMVGLSHSAFRTLLMEMGGVGLLFTEMLAAKRLPYDSPEHSPLLVRSEVETPLFYQLFLADEKPVAKAVDKLEELGADGIDINLGCPAPQLRRRGAGGYLAENREMVRRIVQTFRKKTSLTLSAKIRLGTELNENRLIEFAKMLEDEGVELLTIHARLHGEKFCRVPRWQYIGMVKEQISIPILANGGIMSVADAKRCLELSGADGLMLGRGGVESPQLFSEIAHHCYGLERKIRFTQPHDMFFRFVELLQDRFSGERQLGRLKQFTPYFASAYSFGHHLAAAVQTSKSMEQAVERAEEFFIQAKKA